MKVFHFLILFLLSSFVGADVDSTDDESLQETLDKDLEALTKSLEENGASDDLQELLKSKEGREKLKQMLKSDDEDEDDEDDSDESEDEDEEDMKSKKKSNMKKSFDDIIEDNESVIDAVPVLKSFAKLTSKLIDRVEEIYKSVEDISIHNQKNANILKSMSKVIVSSSELIKSTNTIIDSIGETPMKVPGLKGQGEIETILKSSEGKNFTHAEIKTALIKGMEAGKISTSEVSAWEMGKYNSDILSNNTKSLIKSYINGDS